VSPYGDRGSDRQLSAVGSHACKLLKLSEEAVKLSPVDIEQHLEPGEKIKWMGSPSHKAAAENSLSTAILGTIFFGLLCVYHPSPAHPASELVDQLTDGSRLVVPFHIGPPMSDEDKSMPSRPYFRE
jgi:hypothetical protein